MKMPKEMWIQVLYSLPSESGKANQGRKMTYSQDKKRVFKLLNKIGISSFQEYEGERNDIYNDVLWDMASELEKIELEEDDLAKEEFFKNYKLVDFDNMKRIFKNIDYNVFTKDLKKYFIENMISYPSLDCLYLFRKNLSQEQLRIGLNNFFDQTKFHKFNNQSHEDYWDNILSSKNVKKLLDLIEIANMPKTDLNRWNKIGFLNTYNQLRFDKMLDSGCIDESKFGETQSETLYSIKVSLDKLVLSSKSGVVGRLNDDMFEFIKEVFVQASELEVWEHPLQKLNEIYLLTNDIDKFEVAKKKTDYLRDNILDYIDLILKDVKEIRDNHMLPKEINEKAIIIGEKILLKFNLESTLSANNKKVNKMKV